MKRFLFFGFLVLTGCEKKTDETSKPIEVPKKEPYIVYVSPGNCGMPDGYQAWFAQDKAGRWQAHMMHNYHHYSSYLEEQ